MLDAVLGVDLYSYQMRQGSSRDMDGSDRTYYGLVITEKDRLERAWFADNLEEQQVPSLNERNLFGYLIGAIQAQQNRIEQLEQKIRGFLN